MAFELAYLADMPKTLRALAKTDLSIESWMNAFEAKQKPDNKDIEVLMILAMAATYDPDPEAYLGIRLPVDLETCALNETLWANWLAWDPVLMADRPEVIANLKSLKALWLECGTEDQYNLLYGARRLNACRRDGAHEEFPKARLPPDRCAGTAPRAGL